MSEVDRYGSSRIICLAGDGALAATDDNEGGDRGADDDRDRPEHSEARSRAEADRGKEPENRTGAADSTSGEADTHDRGVLRLHAHTPTPNNDATTSRASS